MLSTTKPNETSFPHLANIVKIVGVAKARRVDEHEMWWRGHTDFMWELCPHVFRDQPPDEAAFRERNLTLRFITFAASRYEKCPAVDDYASWLILMQHYGLPTRLLDWTESPLYAAFFAVEEAIYKKEEDLTDGALYLLRPRGLNSVTGDGALHTSVQPTVTGMIKDAFLISKPEFDVPVAIMPQHIDIRMTVQLSRFTLHPNMAPLEQARDNYRYLEKFTIPASAKPSILQELNEIGINRANLFPDLDNLSAFLKRENFYRPVSQPDSADQTEGS